MAVVHYTNGCGRCGKKSEITDDKDKVTCKRCLKKLETKTEKIVKKAKKKNINIKFKNDKKHGYCLKVNNDAILTLGKDLDSKIGTMMLLKRNGMSSCSIKFKGPVTQMLTNKELNILRNCFSTINNDNGNVTVNDCKEIFER